MNILIIGAGFSGSIFGRLAADAGHNVTIIDRRNHIGGNSYSYCDKESGIEVHKYGPHIFHTNSQEIWKYINRFSHFNNYINRVKAISNKSVYSLPINLGTINQFFGKTLTPLEAKEFIEAKRMPKEIVDNLEDHILASLGQELYEAFYKYYTIKQWGTHPKNIPVSTAKRLPIRFEYNDNYFNDQYQGIPTEGYEVIFKRMLDHKNIRVELESDFEEYRSLWREKYEHLIFCGSLDAYFQFTYGDLPYRTVKFEEIREKEIQGNAVINYTDDSVLFTRIHEHKWFTPEKAFEMSVGFREYASETSSREDPYYPIRNETNDIIYNKYKQLAANERNVTFIGRLAEYRYYNMDQVIAASISKFKKWVKQY